MREAAEKKKELEKQHGESVNELRTAQAQLGLLASNKNTEVERAQHSQNIESLQVGVFFSLKKWKFNFKIFSSDLPSHESASWKGKWNCKTSGTMSCCWSWPL